MSDITPKNLDLTDMADVEAGKVALEGGGAGMDERGYKIEYFLDDVKKGLKKYPKEMVVHLKERSDKKGDYDGIIYVPNEDFDKKW